MMDVDRLNAHLSEVHDAIDDLDYAEAGELLCHALAAVCIAAGWDRTRFRDVVNGRLDALTLRGADA